MQLCSLSILKQSNNEKLEEIKKRAILENSIYYLKNRRRKMVMCEPINHNSSSKKAPTTYFKNLTGFSTTLEKYIIYIANSPSLEFKNGSEKMFFLCNGVFPNDNKFLNLLSENNFFDIFDEFVTQYSYIDEKYQDNIKLDVMQKDLQFTKLIKKYNDELIECQKYFYKFHGICRMDIIINKLLHIYCFNQELYNNYKLNDKKQQKLTKKLG